MDESGDWRLAPAYDLTCAAGPGGEHYLDVEGEGRRPARAHIEKFAKRHGLSEKHTATIVDDVIAAISGWDVLAKKTGVSTASVKWVAQAHARVLDTF